MTTLSATHTAASTTVLGTATAFERLLLCTAASLDLYVAQRLERRSNASGRRAAATQTAAVTERCAAQARGAIGILPR